MRIGIFTDSYTPQVNGVSVSCMNLYKGLTMLGNDVFVITTDHRDNKEVDSHVIRLEGFNVPLKNFDGFQLLPVANRFYKLIKELNLDIIHVNTEFSIGRFGVRCAKKFKIPYFYTMHTMYEDYMHHVIKVGKFALRKPYLQYIEKMVRWFSLDSSGIILPHEKVRKMFTKYELLDNISIIPTGIDLDKFYKSKYKNEDVLKLKESLGLKDEFIMLSIGRVAPEKSIDFLIDEFAKFYKNVNCKMVVVGDGPAMPALKKQVKELNLEEYVIFTGMVPYTDIGLYYQLGDAFINASVTETQGLTYIEALSSGQPVVVRYDKNLEDLVIDHENGLFYNSKEEFKDKMLELINDKALLEKLKNNALDSVRMYSKESFAKTVNDLYLTALKK